MLFASPSSGGGGVGSPAAHVLRDDRDDAPTSPPTAPTRPLDRPSPTVKSAAPPSDAAAASASHRPAESSDHGGDGNAAAGARGKKAVWTVAPSGANETGLVMGADSLAAVSESALRPSAKTSDSDSLESLPDGSSATAPSDGCGTSSSPSANDVRGANGQTPILPGMPPIGGTGQEFSPVEIANRHNRNPGQQRRVEFMPRPQRGGYRRGGSYNDRRRGIISGGPSREGNGSRRDHERGGYDRNGPRGFSRRDPHMWMPLPPQQAQIQPPPPPPMCYYIPMPPHRPPFMRPMVSYPEVPYYVYYLPVPPPHPQTPINMPFVPHQPVPVDYQATIPFPSPVDHHQLMRQIEFYFSDYNLNTDTFLRNNMDSQGGVPISLVAGFNMVKTLTNNEPNSIPHILTALQVSTEVEVQGDKIRRRDGWVPPNRNQYDLASGPRSPATPDGDSVIALLHTFGLEGSSSQHSTTPTDNVCLGNKSASGSSNNQMQDGV
ncbi:unnamed protein product [Musa acuminata subsp. burmannicoides]